MNAMASASFTVRPKPTSTLRILCSGWWSCVGSVSIVSMPSKIEPSTMSRATRMLSAPGMGNELPPVSHAGPQYRRFNAEWKELLSIDWADGSISGGPEVNFVQVIRIPDAPKAAERDAAFFSGQAAPPPAFPSLTDGMLRRDADGKVQAPAGLLSPHGTVRQGGRSGRFDDVVGLGFVLVSADGADGWADLDHKYIPFMEHHGIDTMLVRPDSCPYGALSRASEVNGLLDDLAADLGAFGVAFDGAPER